MNPIVAKLGAGVVLLALVVGGWLYVRALRADLHAAEQSASDARDDVRARDQTITTLKADAVEKAAQQKRLDATRAATDARQARILAETRRIVHESPENQAWADTVLPADIARLQASPALTGAGDYLQRMPDGEPVHASGAGSGDER